MKAITPVIATVMLMLITVGTVSMSYAWLLNMMATQTEKNIAIPVGGVQCYSNRISVIVTNAGANSNITDDDIIVADINGVSVRNTPFFGGFNLNGLVGYWRFEQSKGSAATNDSSGYGNMGTLTSMSLTGTATSGPTLGGRFGNALVFDGVNDYVDAGNATSLKNTPAVTVGAWVKPTGTPAYGNVIAKVPNPTGGWILRISQGSNGRLTPHVHTNTWYTCSGSVIPLNVWTHVAIRYDGSTLKGYVNGVEDCTATPAVGGNIPLSIGAVRIGNAEGETNYFPGLVDEVMIWNRSLALDEIKQLNKTNAGNFTLAPNSAVTLIKGYPVFAKGRYTVRIGTRNGVMERTVDCM